MEYYVCTCCGNVFDGSTIKANEGSYTTNCPISTCNGMIFEVDEEMIEVILMLNDKGYTTRYCCSGHLYGSSGGYILFYKECIPSTPPKDWVMDRDAIRYCYSKNATPIKKLKERHKRIEELMKWCEGLEDISC